MQKILLISDHGDPLAPLGGAQAGGQNNYVLHLAVALGRLGYKVDVITHWSDPAVPQFEQFGAACRVVRVAAGHTGTLSKEEIYTRLPAFYAELHELVEMGSYDVVHTNYWISGVLGTWLQQDHGLPLVHTSHSLAVAKHQGTGYLDPVRLDAEKHVLRSADAVIATTSYEKELITSFVRDCAPIWVVPCGVNPVFGPRVGSDRRMHESDTTFLFVGRLVKEKGIFTLLKAFQLLLRHNPLGGRVRLVIAGGDRTSLNPHTKLPRDPELQAALEGCQKAVSFIGPQTAVSLAGLYTGADATVVPSYYESFGMVAAESLTCGTPVLASAVGGLQDLIAHGKTGLLVQPKSPVDLACMMHAITTEPRLYQTLRDGVSQSTHHQFDWDRLVKNIEALYTEAGTGEISSAVSH